MLPRSRRLRAKEVVEVLKSGSGLRAGQYLSAKAAYGGAQDGTMRFAVVLSKKVAKTAVVRNRIRRGLYRAVDRYLRQYPERAQDARVVLFIRSIPEDPAACFVADLNRMFPSR